MKQETKLEEAKRLYQTANADQRYVLERLYPELKESEDEKNVKDLIDELKCSLRAANCQNEACNGGHEKRIALLEWAIAWLEKQGQKFQYWKPSEEQLEALDYAYNLCPDTERGNYYEGVLETIIDDLHKFSEKQGETSPVLSNSLNTGKREIKGNEVKISTKWSKEDEEEFKIAIETLHEAGQHCSAMWLKSIKQRIVQ